MQQITHHHLTEMIHKHLYNQFNIRADDDRYLIVTPMLYPDNIRIAIAIAMRDEHRVLLTDNGEAWGYAFVHGVDEPVIRDRIELTRARFRLADIEGGDLILDVSTSNIAERLFKLANAVQDVAYLVYGVRLSQPSKIFERTAN